MNIKKKAKIGILWIAAKRFCALGEGTRNGTYLERKQLECEKYASVLNKKVTVVASDIVCTVISAVNVVCKPIKVSGIRNFVKAVVAQRSFFIMRAVYCTKTV